MKNFLQNIADAKKLGTIYVMLNQYQGSLIANFFVLRDVEGSSKKVALEVYHDEYGEDLNVSEFAVPTDRISMKFVHSVRMKKHGEYTGLAPDIQIYVPEIGWRTVTKWDEKGFRYVLRLRISLIRSPGNANKPGSA